MIWKSASVHCGPSEGDPTASHQVRAMKRRILEELGARAPACAGTVPSV